MASNLLRLPVQQTITIPKPSHPLPLSRTLFPSFPNTIFTQKQYPNFTFFPQKPLHSSKISSQPLQASSLSSYNPPTTKEEAILQTKTCLSTTLEKPLNNPRLAGKLKKQKQPRFRVEIPIIDDSDESLTQLAFQVFGDLPIRRKGTQVKILLLWTNRTLTVLANKTFSSSHSSNPVENVDMSSAVTSDYTRILNSAHVAVFLAPEASQLEAMKVVSEGLYPKPVMIFNPKWGFEEETGFRELSGFVGSFEVVYSFMGLEVKGVFSKRKGIVFKYVRDGVLSGERWTILMEEEGELKVVSRFKNRPSIGEVENVLYNLMAVNSPVTKSVKFIRDLVSSVTGKK